MIWSTGDHTLTIFWNKRPLPAVYIRQEWKRQGTETLSHASEKDSGAGFDQRVGILNRGESHCDLDIDLMLDFTSCFI
jgi:hypothetical protein